MSPLNQSLNILFLPRWYPNRHDPMPGLFIQRQAEALAKSNQVVVLYVHPDPECPSEFELDYAEEQGVNVIRVYYQVPAPSGSFFSPFVHLFRFVRAHLRGLDMAGDFSPDIIHSHILTRTGVMGHWLSRRLKTPHVISEHWSRYFPENNTYRGGVRKFLTRYVVRRAAAVITVSEKLQQAMQTCRLRNRNDHIVPNVIDTMLFSPSPGAGNKSLKQFIHVSCFEDRSKNISGFLAAVKQLRAERSDFRCIMVGEGPDLEDMQNLAMELGLIEDCVFFVGLIEGKELADLYQQSDFCVLSSRYETFGTIVIESLACGTPVVATEVGIVPEVINSSNGIIVPTEDEGALRDALREMLDRYDSFDRDAIREGIQDKYTPEAVGNQMTEIYRNILGYI